MDREQGEKTREQQPVREGSAVRSGPLFVLFVPDFVPTGPSLGNAEQDQCSRGGEQG
jgi:hypothetical protein